MQRVEIENLIKKKIENDEQTGRIIETPSKKKVQQRKKPEKTKDDISSLLQNARNQKEMITNLDDPFLYISSINNINEPEFQVNIELEAKLKQLIELYSKVM